MSNIILIVGRSGSGKTTSMRNLNPEETFLIASINKSLPFKGWKKKYPEYKSVEENGKKVFVGNRKVMDSSDRIIRMFQWISQERPNVKSIILDDAQYIMANEFMRRSGEKGYDKFTEIGRHFWDIMNEAGKLRDDLNVYILIHEDEDEKSGRREPKTIGKMLKEKIDIAGMSTVVLFTEVEDGKYYFTTQSDGFCVAKSPIGMFPEIRMDNDLKIVDEAIRRHEEESDE